MELSELKSILKGSTKKHIIIGTCIFLFGAFFIVGSIVGLDQAASTRVNNAMIVVGGLIAVIGFIMVMNSSRIHSSVNKETHPLIRAILDNDSEALVWAHALLFKVKGDVTNMTNWNMILYFKDGKRTTVEIKNEAVYNKLNAYFKKNFPKAELNYNEKIKREMKEKYGFK